MKREPKLYETWPVIVLSVVLCVGLPVAPYLALRRLAKDRAPRPVLAVIFMAGGLVAAGFSLLMLFGPSTQEPPPAFYVLFALWGVSSLGWIVAGILAWNNARLVDRYADLLAAHAPTTVDDLAGKAGRTDVGRMVGELSAILESGALPAYRLDPGTRWIERAEPPAAGTESRITFDCPGCGATNAGAAVVGGMAACAYCDRPFRAGA